MVKCGCERIHETPIVFKDREEGESKLSMKQNLFYLRQLLGMILGGRYEKIDTGCERGTTQRRDLS